MEFARLLRGTKRRKIMFDKLLKEAADSYRAKEFGRAHNRCNQMASLCWDEYRAENYRRDRENDKALKKIAGRSKKFVTK